MFKEFNHLFVFISTNNQVARRSCDNFTKDSNLRPRVECTERERIFATVDGFWVEINPRIFRNSHGTQFRNFISRILDESSSSLPANYSQWYVIIGRGSNCIAQSMLLNRLAEWLASDFERSVVNIHFYSPPFHRVFLVCLFFSSYTGCS